MHRVKKDENIQQLKERIRILEQENEFLAESREELLLLGLISEQLEAEKDEKQLLESALEKTSILKNIPFCAVFTHKDSRCQLFCSYSTFQQDDISTKQLDLKPSLENCYSKSTQVIDASKGDALFDLHHNDATFSPKAYITIPFQSRYIPKGMFLFAFEDESMERVSNQLILLQRTVEMIITKMDNLFLRHQLEEQNKALDKSIYKKTAELQASTATLKQNIEQQKQLKAQFYQAQKMEAIGNLAGGVAHDFNNILTVINGYSELLLLQTPDDNPNFSRIQEIHNAGKRAANLTNQLLAFSRKQVIKPVPINLNEQIADAEKMLQRLIGEHIYFQTILEPDLCTIQADPGQVNQILLNLAVNARDAMPKGGQLTVRTRQVEIGKDHKQPEFSFEPGKFVCISVQDTGTGMDEETRQHIFEPFFTTKPLGEGTGLGLSTVFGIVQQNKGLIDVESTPGVGTTFSVFLPCSDTSLEADADHAIKTERSKKNECIMVVEDDANVRKLTRLVLERDGYKVLLAANTNEAIETLKNSAYEIHLLLTDVIMPGGSGKDLVARARELRPEMKVLYMSGYTDDLLAQQGILPNEVELIAKPFANHQLLNRIHTMLKN